MSIDREYRKLKSDERRKKFQDKLKLDFDNKVNYIFLRKYSLRSFGFGLLFTFPIALLTFLLESNIIENSFDGFLVFIVFLLALLIIGGMVRNYYVRKIKSGEDFS